MWAYASTGALRTAPREGSDGLRLAAQERRGAGARLAVDVNELDFALLVSRAGAHDVATGVALLRGVDVTPAGACVGRRVERGPADLLGSAGQLHDFAEAVAGASHLVGEERV